MIGLLLATAGFTQWATPFPPPAPAPSILCPLTAFTPADSLDTLTHAPSVGELMHAPNCSWYSQGSCCSAEDTLRISHGPAPIALIGTTSGCRHRLTMLMCSTCSPAQADIFRFERLRGGGRDSNPRPQAVDGSGGGGGRRTPVLRVCESFCDDLWYHCGLATYLDGRLPRGRVSKAFGGGAELCRAAGYHVVRSGARSNVPCFSAASARREAGTLGTFVALSATVVSVMAAISMFRVSPS